MKHNLFLSNYNIYKFILGDILHIIIKIEYVSNKYKLYNRKGLASFNAFNIVNEENR